MKQILIIKVNLNSFSIISSTNDYSNYNDNSGDDNDKMIIWNKHNIAMNTKI